MSRPAKGFLSAATFVLVASGCGPSSSAPVAEAGDWSLSEQRLADLLVLAQPFVLEPNAVDGLVRHWVSAASLAQSATDPQVLRSDSVVDHVTWLLDREELLALDREQRLGETVEVDRDLAELAFEDGTYRLLAHVVRRVGPATPIEERNLQRSTAERLLTDLVNGGSWDQAVAQSEDPETASQGGLLGLFVPGELPASLERAASSLEPGQISSVTPTAVGYHILYRPRFEDVSELFRTRLRDRRMAEADSAASAELLVERGIEVEQGAANRVRAMADEPGAVPASADALVVWQGGALSAQSVARTMAALNDDTRKALATSNDEAVGAFLEELAARELRVSEARSRGLAVPDSTRSSWRGEHMEEVDFWAQSLGLDVAADDRRGALARHMEELVSRRAELRGFNPLLEDWLRQRIDTRVDAGGIEGAIALAQEMIAAAQAPQEAEGDVP